VQEVGGACPQAYPLHLTCTCFSFDLGRQYLDIPSGEIFRIFCATKYLSSAIMLRPEVRFDHSWDALGYNNGKARNQFFFGSDLIYKL
jgi:hypothetical protein